MSNEKEKPFKILVCASFMYGYEGYRVLEKMYHDGIEVEDDDVIITGYHLYKMGACSKWGALTVAHPGQETQVVCQVIKASKPVFDYMNVMMRGHDQHFQPIFIDEEVMFIHVAHKVEKHWYRIQSGDWERDAGTLSDYASFMENNNNFAL